MSDGLRPGQTWQGHVIVCGLQGLGLRTVEQLHLAGVDVVVVDDRADPRLIRVIDAWGIPHLDTSPRQADTLFAAGLAGAVAMVCVEENDLYTLETALLAHDLRPEMRIVVQVTNPGVGRAVSEVVGAGRVLDVAGLAGPSVVEACLPHSVLDLTLAGERFVVDAVTVERPGTLRQLYGDLAPIAVVPSGGGESVICPGRDHRVAVGDQVTLLATPQELADSGINDAGTAGAPRQTAASRRGRRWRQAVHRYVSSVAAETDSALRRALLVAVAVVVVSTVVLRFGYRLPHGAHLRYLDSLYFTVETIATVGFGDYTFSQQSAWMELFGIALIVVGVALVTMIFAQITNLLVSRRIALTFGYQRVTGMSGHVILVGLGSVGVRVLEELVERGIDVVVIESDEANRHLARARSLSVPVIFADATLRQTLQTANLASASAVAIMTSDDLTNIETGLAVRDQLGDRWPGVPVVLRIFDRPLARIIEGGFGFRYVRSTSALAAPWFVGAALGLDVLSTFYVEREPFLVAQLTVAIEGGLAGLAMQDLPAQTRVIAISRATAAAGLGDAGRLEHPPRRNTRFEPGDRAYLVGPYEELLTVLRRDAQGPQASDNLFGVRADQTAGGAERPAGS